MIGAAKSSPARVSLDGVEIVYDTFGDPAYPPLLLIAGLANQMIDWRDEFCSELAEQGYWVVRFDNRDAGLSTRLDGTETPGLFAISSAYVLGTSIRASFTLLDMAADARQLAWQLYERCPNPAGTARQLAAILASRHQLQGAHSLAIPTLITHGAADPLLPVAHARNAARVIPEAKLLIIDGLGHEFPRQIWSTIIRAIREYVV